MCEAVRRAVGDGYTVMLDSTWAYQYPEALRAGRTVACDTRGDATGPAALTPVVARRCREDSLATPAGDTTASRAGTWNTSGSIRAWWTAVSR